MTSKLKPLYKTGNIGAIAALMSEDETCMQMHVCPTCKSQTKHAVKSLESTDVAICTQCGQGSQVKGSTSLRERLMRWIATKP